MKEIPGDGMSRLGVEGHIKKVTDMLSPHLDAATSKLVSFLKEEEPGPEERLAEFLRWRAWRKGMGFSDEAIEEEILEMMGDEYEGAIVGGNAYHDGGRSGSGGDSGYAAHGLGQRNRPGDKEPDGKDKPDSFGIHKIR